MLWSDSTEITGYRKKRLSNYRGHKIVTLITEYGNICGLKTQTELKKKTKTNARLVKYTHLIEFTIRVMFKEAPQ